MEKILFKILRAVLKAITPQVRAVIVEFLGKLKVAAKATPNEWDDVLVSVLEALFATEDG